MREATPVIATPACDADWRVARAIVEAYVAGLPIDPAVQGVAAELAALPRHYGAPDGAFLLATRAGDALGCVGLRRLDARRAEMKRLYVTPAGRGGGLGRMLAGAIIERARRLGYRGVVLDTLGGMDAARALYASLGFRPIAPYRDPPTPGADHFELMLD